MKKYIFFVFFIMSGKCLYGMENAQQLSPQEHCSKKLKFTDNKVHLFLRAVDKGHYCQAEHYLNNHKKLLQKCRANKKDPVAIAVKKGYVQMVEMLVKHGASLKLNKIPLFFRACFNNDIAMMECLVQYDDVDLNCNGSEKYWPFNYSSVKDETKNKIYELFEREFITDLRNKHKIQNYLNIVSSYARKELINHACKLGANINGLNIVGNTALHDAWFHVRELKEQHLSAMTYLMSKGAKIEQPLIDKVTTFHCACIHGNNNIISFFLNNGANINHTDKYAKRTGLHWSVWSYFNERYISFNGLMATTFLLICSEADPKLQDSEEESVFNWHTTAWAKEILNPVEKELLNKIINLDIKNKQNCKDLLQKIYELQKKRIDPKTGRKDFLVADEFIDEEGNNYYKFKDIYQKYIF